MIVQNSRIQMKYSTIPGVVPTIPLSDDHTDGTWLPTDLYVGEVFLNSADNLAWWRSLTGLIPFGATGGTSVFIGDFVPASIGGTYGGPVFGPEFNATLIEGDTVQGVTGTFSGPVGASTFYGDGSNLTGIVATWNGGVVGNTAQFQSDVTFDTTIYVDNIDSIGSELQINAPIVTNAGATFNGTVTAVSFIGDGSQLTGITGGTDRYTTAANLVGNTIQFDRNDLVNAYSVDLTSIAGAPVTQIGWDDTINEFTLELADGTIFQLPITQFSDIIVNGSVTANYFIGDGSQLTNLPITTGPTGATGETGPQGPTGANGSTPYMVISYASTGFTLATGTVTLPITTTLYIGWNTGTRLRLWHDSTHYMEGVITSSMTYPQVAGNDITVLIDFVVGTGTPGSWLVGIAGDQGGGGGGTATAQTLAQTLAIGNTSGNNNISLSNSTLTSISDSIVADGNTLTEAKFSFEDIGGAWAPTIFVNNGNATNYITVGDSESVMQNTQVDAFVNRYAQVKSGPTQILLTVSDLNDGNNSVIDITKSSIVITGTSPTFQGLEYASDYSANFTNRSLVDKAYVDGRPTPNLQTVLQTGNTSGNNNIVFANNYGLENSSGEADIKLTAFQIDAIHQKFTNATDWKRGLFQGSGHNGTASITGDDYNVTLDLYRGSSLDVTNTYARLFYQETQISTGNGYQTYAQINKDNILVSSAYNTTLANSNFAGIQYNHDYSSNFTTRSLVDKAYVDAAVAGITGGTGGSTSIIPAFTGSETFKGRTFRNNSTTTDSTDPSVSWSITASNLAQAIAGTNVATKQVRLRHYASIVATGRYTGLRSTTPLWFVGGGFRFICDVSISDTAYSLNSQNFYGMSPATTDLAYGGAGLTLVSTLTNVIGFGSDTTDTNMQIMFNDAAGTCTKIDCGINFPANRTAGAALTNVYRMQMYNEPSSTNVLFRIENLENNAVFEYTATTNLPAHTSVLNVFASRAMGSPVTNSGQFDLMKLGAYILV